ncbi:uncharacterized protein LOC143216924 [Lasioglossum baleicum]|uniref:uncharacterized protein LOC143216924 n=1 Tax=Lasioglossum baleicum TaxID=434251 RepID=UPI003FCEBB91
MWCPEVATKHLAKATTFIRLPQRIAKARQSTCQCLVSKRYNIKTPDTAPRGQNEYACNYVNILLLSGDETSWPEFKVEFDSVEMPEQLKRALVHVAIEENSTVRRLLDSVSSLQKICRIIGHCLKFCKRQRLAAGVAEPLGGGETALAVLALCKFVQGETYAAEIKLLADKKPLERSSNLLSLSPFLDTDGLIRVGGRLKNSTLAYSTRYPILLPKSHRLTNFIIEREHRRNLHAGVQGTIAAAVHIEIVGDLTTDSFIGALKRFISRRGKIISLHSDNGTAFTGAARELKELHEFLARTNIKSIIRDLLQESQISWHFIPPNAPHFGGLWEAAVKSAKFHMHRVMGNAHLTYEEVQTLFCEIEAILNSRPITPLSEDPNDMACLTPGHFLIGEELNSFPREDLSGLNENRLSRWQRVEQLCQHFWSRWSREYLSQLQEKSKWRTNKGSQLQLGQLVLVKQQGLAPLQWIMGRVQEIHPGPDDAVRAASI